MMKKKGAVLEFDIDALGCLSSLHMYQSKRVIDDLTRLKLTDKNVVDFRLSCCISYSILYKIKTYIITTLYIMLCHS